MKVSVNSGKDILCLSRVSLTCQEEIGLLEGCFYIEEPYCVSAAGSLEIQQEQ